MDIQKIREICLSLPGVTEDVKWENHLCFNVGGKMFLITSPDEFPINASFKVTEKNFIELTDLEGFIPAPYLARYKWVMVDDIRRLSRKEWEVQIKSTYQIIFSKLPSKIKKAITNDE